MTCGPRSSRRDFSEYAPASPWKAMRRGFCGGALGWAAPPRWMAGAVFGLWEWITERISLRAPRGRRIEELPPIREVREGVFDWSADAMLRATVRAVTMLDKRRRMLIYDGWIEF